MLGRGGWGVGRRCRRRVVFGAAVAALAGAGPATFAVVSSASAREARVARMAQRSPVQIVAATRLPRGASFAGALPAATAISGAVVLAPRDPAALREFIADVSERGSAQFGHYLAPGQFAGRFGPTAAAVTRVRRVLRRDGLALSATSRDGLLVPFRGSAATVQRAFTTRLSRVRLPSGALSRAATTAIRLPASIAGEVTTVVGIDGLARQQRADLVHGRPSQVAHHARAVAGSFPHPAGSPTPCAAARTAATRGDGLTDDQIADAYGAFGLYGAGDLGAGQHIALYENEQFARSDIRTFDACYFGARAAGAMMGHLHVHAVDGGEPAGYGSGEASLDVEDVSAMAPGATIDVYEGPFTGDDSNYDSLDEYTAIVDADADRVVSTSWGLCEQSVEAGQTGIEQAENILFEQAAAQGQTVFDAAGDNGSDDCNAAEKGLPAGQNPLSIDDPTSQPYVVAVGGTSITDATPGAHAEQVWNDGPKGGAGGGGISQAWAMPSWQLAATVPGIVRPGSPTWDEAGAVERQYGFPTNFCQSTIPGATTATACRLAPDVSAQADEFTGSVTVYSREYAGAYPGHGWTTTGGTSSASPIWAAMLTDINASATCRGSATTAQGVGFVSPLLYAVASDPMQYAASFHDITTGDNDVDGLGGGDVYRATTGYDLASGLGSPELTGTGASAGLAYYLCTAAGATPRATRPSVTALAPTSGPATGGTTVTVTGSGFSATGPDAVSGVQIGTTSLPAGAVDVVSPTTLRITMPAAAGQLPPASPAPQDGSGPANVIVTLRDGQSSAPTAASQFAYVDTAAGGAAVPSVSAVSATGGAATDPAAVTILGSGFTGATGVTIGGVAATSFTVDSAHRITVTPPPLSAATACAALPSTGVYAGENAGNDICQTQVRVVAPGGSSAVAPIPVPYEGARLTNSLGDVILPAGCGCEDVPAPDEYDYLPTPTVTSVSTSGGAADLASEKGTTLVTIHGTGFSPLGIDWVDFGDPSLGASQATGFTFVTGTEIQITAPAQAPTVDPLTVPLAVHTLGGQSAAARATYAGIPVLDSVSTPGHHRRLGGLSGAADTGDTVLDLRGRGFAGQLTGAIHFADTGRGLSSGTAYGARVVSDRALVVGTPQVSPGLDAVRVCTVSGCSVRRRADRLWLYAPGAPRTFTVDPATGPVAGGTRVTVHGVNLGCALRVSFGRRAVPAVLVPTLLDCGATDSVRARSPRGRAGASVPVGVTTVESVFAGSGSGSGSGSAEARFRYAR